MLSDLKKNFISLYFKQNGLITFVFEFKYLLYHTENSYTYLENY